MGRTMGTLRFALLNLSILLLFSLHAFGLGMVSDYLEKDTLEVREMSSKIYSIRVQNPDPTPIAVSLSYPSEFLTPLDPAEEYIIPAQSSFPILFNVSVPEVVQNETHTVAIMVKQTGAEAEGLPILLSVGKSFTLKIVNKEDPILWPYMVVGAIALSILVMIAWMHRSMREIGKTSSTSSKKRP